MNQMCIKMIKVKKSIVWKKTHLENCECFEVFNRKKIEMALVRSGVRGNLVKEIAEKVEPYDGISTDEIDKFVLEELELRDPESAKYWKIKRDYDRRRFT